MPWLGGKILLPPAKKSQSPKRSDPPTYTEYAATGHIASAQKSQTDPPYNISVVEFAYQKWLAAKGKSKIPTYNEADSEPEDWSQLPEQENFIGLREWMVGDGESKFDFRHKATLGLQLKHESVISGRDVDQFRVNLGKYREMMVYREYRDRTCGVWDPGYDSSLDRIFKPGFLDTDPINMTGYAIRIDGPSNRIQRSYAGPTHVAPPAPAEHYRTVAGYRLPSDTSLAEFLEAHDRVTTPENTNVQIPEEFVNWCVVIAAAWLYPPKRSPRAQALARQNHQNDSFSFATVFKAKIQSD